MKTTPSIEGVILMMEENVGTVEDAGPYDFLFSSFHF